MPLDHAQLSVIARELGTLAADIESIGAALCADATVAAAHDTALQSIDLIGQRQRALADLIVADNLDTALGECRLDRIVALFSANRA